MGVLIVLFIIASVAVSIVVLVYLILLIREAITWLKDDTWRKNQMFAQQSKAASYTSNSQEKHKESNAVQGNEYVVCPNCGEKNAKTSTYCHQCGTKLK